MNPATGEVNAAIAKKAFEISYALVRLADVMGKDQFAGYLRSLGLEILYSATTEKHDETLRSLRSIEYFARLAGSTGSVSSTNSEVIAEEANELSLVIAGLLDSEKSPSIDITQVFSKEPVMVYTHSDTHVPESIPENKEPSAGTNVPDLPEVEVKPFLKLRKTEQPEENQIRQSAILERIRQSGNRQSGKISCRMKEIQDLFPNVSERTLRYDLQTLIEQGLVERVGLSGPAIYYQAREVVAV